MEITQLRYFMAVAKTGKIVTAADNLFVTPPAISTSIAQLERELGVPLFTRHANRLQLNKQGEIFLGYVEAILKSINSARTEIQESIKSGPQHISVAVTSSNLWIDLTAAFSLEYPHFTLTTGTMATSDLLAGTFSSRFSFILASDGDLTPKLMDECNSLLLFYDRPAVMVHKSHPLAHRDSLSLLEISRQKLIWPRTNPNFTEKYYQLFRDNGIPIPVICTYSYLICQSMVAQSAAVALTTMHAQNACMVDFRFIPLEANDTQWAQRMYWREDRPLSDAELSFRDFMMEYHSDCEK